MDVRALPAEVIPAHRALSERARDLVDPGAMGTSTSKRLALVFSRALLARASVEELTTTLSAAHADLGLWSKAFPHAEEAGIDLDMLAASFLRLGVGLDDAAAWSSGCTALREAFGHPDALDEVCAHAALGADLGMPATLYVAAWPRLASLSRHERVLSRTRMVEVASMAAALAPHDVDQGEVVAWVVEDWEPAAAARIVAAGGTAAAARTLYAAGSTSADAIIADLARA